MTRNGCALLLVTLGFFGFGCAGSSKGSASGPSPEWALDVDKKRGAASDPASGSTSSDDKSAHPDAPRILTPCTERSWPKYRGHKIDIDLKDAELHDVFRLLADVGRINIVVSDDVAGAITLRLRQVPWDQVLDTVVKVKGLKLVHEQGVYRVTTSTSPQRF